MTAHTKLAWDALRAVEDPEAGISIVDLGLVYAIDEDHGTLTVTITFTSEGCPAAALIINRVEAALKALPGSPPTRVEVTFEPPWTPHMISPEARALLGA